MAPARLLAPALACLALLVAAVPAARADFSNASLNGRFTSQILVSVPLVNGQLPQYPATVLLSFDGEGHVSGVRTVMTWNYGGSLPREPQPLRQALSGTYAIDPDGTGQMILTASPDWIILNQQQPGPVGPNDWFWRIGPTETWQITVSRGGAGFSFAGSVQKFQRLNPPDLYAMENLTWIGEAVSQDSPCGEAAAEVAAGARTRRP